MCWDQWKCEGTYALRMGSGCCKQATRREDRLIESRARTMATASSSTIHAEVAGAFRNRVITREISMWLVKYGLVALRPLCYVQPPSDVSVCSGVLKANRRHVGIGSVLSTVKNPLLFKDSRCSCESMVTLKWMPQCRPEWETAPSLSVMVWPSITSDTRSPLDVISSILCLSDSSKTSYSHICDRLWQDIRQPYIQQDNAPTIHGKALARLLAYRWHTSLDCTISRFTIDLTCVWPFGIQTATATRYSRARNPVAAIVVSYVVGHCTQPLINNDFGLFMYSFTYQPML